MIRLKRNQLREIDRRAIEDYHIPGIVLMENAARSFVELLSTHVDPRDLSVTIVCGGGNNGGDGFAIARHLHNRGSHVDLVLATHAEFRGDALTNRKIAEAMGIESTCVEGAEDVINKHAVDLLIDAVFGTGLSRPVDSDMGILFAIMNECGLPVIAVDVPSGLDCDTGEPLGACVRATRTITFVAEKIGFANPASKQYTGEVVVGDIGCPRELIEAVAKQKL